MKKRISIVIEFYKELWDGTSVFGRIFLFSILIIFFPVVLIAAFCTKVENY